MPRPGDPYTVVLWPDTFTNHFDPHIARAAVGVLERAGFTVVVPTEPLCCGLTWISTGQLGTARRTLQATVAVLRPWIEAGTLVVGLEPSCTAVFRADAPELLPAVREADPDTLVLADGFSCRTQVEHGTGQRPLHLAEALAAAPRERGGHRQRQPAPRSGRGRGALLAATVTAGAGLLAARRWLR